MGKEITIQVQELNRHFSKEDIKKDHEKILEEIIVENFSKMGKEIATKSKKPRVPNRINPR